MDIMQKMNKHLIEVYVEYGYVDMRPVECGYNL